MGEEFHNTPHLIYELHFIHFGTCCANTEVYFFTCVSLKFTRIPFHQ